MPSSCRSITAPTRPSAPDRPYASAKTSIRRRRSGGSGYARQRTDPSSSQNGATYSSAPVTSNIGSPGPAKSKSSRPTGFLLSPDDVPRTEVAVTDHTRGAAAEGPRCVGRRRLEADRRLVIHAEQPSEPSEAVLWDDLGPAGGTGLAGDERERLCAVGETDRSGNRIEPVGGQEPQKRMDRGSPWIGRPNDPVAFDRNAVRRGRE